MQGGGLCWKESHGDEDARTEKERQTKEEVVGLHQGRHGSSWCEPRRYTRQEEVEEVGPHGSNPTAISGTSWKKKKKKEVTTEW